MTFQEILCSLLILLGDSSFEELDLDKVEWTQPKYGHQN